MSELGRNDDGGEAVATAPPNELSLSHEVSGECQWRIDIGSDSEEVEEDEAEEGGETHEGGEDEDQLLQNTIGEFVEEHGGKPVENSLLDHGHQRLRGAVAEIINEKDLKRLRELLREHGEPKQVAFILSYDPKIGEVVQESDTIITVYKLPHFILKACRKVSMVLLLILALVTLASGMAEEGLQTGWLIGSSILVFWIVRIAFDSIACYCRARKMEKRLIQKNESGVTVIRSGQPQEITLCDIVEGDIVCLTATNRIPADGVLIYENALVLDGVLHRKIRGFPFLYSGSKVTEGEGLMLVTSAGINTELAKLMSLVTNFKDDDELLLEARLKKPNPSADICDLKKVMLVGNWIDKPLVQLGSFGLIILIICVLVKFTLFFCGKNKKNNFVQELKGAASVEGLIKIFKRLLNNGGKVTLLAAFIPTLVFGLQHGIKIVISTCLDKWNGKGGSSEQFCQNSSASRTLGVTSIICMDISGRFMFHQREVSRFQIGQEDINGSNCTSKMSQTLLEPLIQGVGASVLVPEIGSPSRTDGLLISWAEEKWNRYIESDLKERFDFVCYRKLSANKEGRGVLLQRKGNGENIWDSHWKGAATTILDMCSDFYDCEGQIHDIKNQKSEFEQAIKEMEDNGMRPIAIAYKQTEVQELVEDGLCLLAIVGVKYQCHEEMKSVVRALRSAGRCIKLVSKDKLSTLRAMAWELGIFSPVSAEEALEGHEFRKLSPDAMVEKVDRITMMGSSNPKDKLLMVKSLKQKDNVVAFIGGWTTRDAPVLQEADVGITIATWSTEMTREISDIVLTSGSSFSSLITILESGGQEYNKIQKFIQIQIISNISALLITAVETVCLGESSITILQALYLNLVLAVLGGLMLVMKVRHTKPSNNQAGKRNESIVTKLMGINILAQVSYQVFIFLVFRFKGEALPRPGMNPMNQEVRKAMVFNGFLLCQVFNNFHPFFDSGNYLCWLFLVSFTGMHVLGYIELCLKLNWMQWAFCFLIAVISWGINSATISISILIKKEI